MNLLVKVTSTVLVLETADRAKLLDTSAQVNDGQEPPPNLHGVGPLFEALQHLSLKLVVTSVVAALLS